MDIKKTWTEQGDPDDGIPAWTARRLIIVPGCCEASAKLATVALRFSYDDICEGGELQDREPQWELTGTHRRVLGSRHLTGNPRLRACFCPHCGTPMPRIQKRVEQLAPICTVTDGGYYCDTCNERLNSCNCWPPEANWEVGR